MTEEEMKAFWKDPNTIQSDDAAHAVEFLYQAFKSRLLAETNMEKWPGLGEKDI